MSRSSDERTTNGVVTTALEELKGASRFLQVHLALVASAALVLLSVVRVYIFASFNTDVALTVLSVASRTQFSRVSSADGRTYALK
ncbi:hypothetical protein PJL15_01878 [Paenarthrobacter nitroguajacolicus]|nr:hypothetical protein [Paenarthrobacter nitroguajacolicus]